MKKLIIFSALAVIMVSCKKTWTCSCKTVSTGTNGGASNSSTITTSTSIPDETQANAKKVCEDLESTMNGMNGIYNQYGVSQSNTCTLSPN